MLKTCYENYKSPFEIWNHFKSESSSTNAAKLFFACKNSYFVNDDVRAGCPKLGHTTLPCIFQVGVWPSVLDWAETWPAHNHGQHQQDRRYPVRSGVDGLVPRAAGPGGRDQVEVQLRRLRERVGVEVHGVPRHAQLPPPGQPVGQGRPLQGSKRWWIAIEALSSDSQSF